MKLKLNRDNIKQSQEFTSQKQIFYATIKHSESRQLSCASDINVEVVSKLMLASVQIDLIKTGIEKNFSESLLFDYMDNTIALLHKTSAEVIGYTFEIAPHTIEKTGFGPPLRILVERLCEDYEIPCLVLFSNPLLRLDVSLELCLFRIAEEVVINALEHSHLTYLHLTQRYEKGIYYLVVHHDGEGLEQEEVDRLTELPTCEGLQTIRCYQQFSGIKVFYKKGEEGAFETIISMEAEGWEMELPEDPLQK
ncbi:MAG TPA: hypothetical protein VHK91_09555 [Flavisolibacter sp.]|nr:hypothetical protein [Flavisolibacter sp.]